MLFRSQADASSAMHEYGVELTQLDNVENVDCIVFAVAHNEFKNLSWKEVDRLFNGCDHNSKKVIIDVKSILNKSEVQKRGFSYWRL